MAPTILIVDDEKNTRDGLRMALDEHFDVYVATDIASAMNVLDSDTVDLVVTDLRLGGEDGMQLIDRMLALPEPPVVIMMTAYGSTEVAVEAMKRGAHDFVTKPINVDKLEIMIRRALKAREMEAENRALKQQIDTRFGLENLIGHSPVMDEVFDIVRQVAPTKATVLIEGESGTGKELVARAIHGLSNRNKAKFVVVHARAFNPQILESELFGHEKGAFTGATGRRIGRFEQADGGTLFLDEIGEIDESTQAKLLRVLGEDRSFERVGGNQPIKADVRLIAATNRDLKKLVDEGKFRDDLFYRLKVVPITMPPLRDRMEDVPLLVQAFLKEFAKENGKPYRELTSDAMQAVLAHRWEGNVRELRTAVEHGVVMAGGPKITLRDLPASVRASGRAGGAKLGLPGPGTDQYLNLNVAEHRLIIRAIEESDGNRTKAAKRLGISRRTLHRKLAELPGIEPKRKMRAPGEPPRDQRAD
jgi:DNA-binding NtrC family response regulator